MAFVNTTLLRSTHDGQIYCLDRLVVLFLWYSSNMVVYSSWKTKLKFFENLCRLDAEKSIQQKTIAENYFLEKKKRRREEEKKRKERMIFLLLSSTTEQLIKLLK